MSLTPLLAAPPAVQIHIACALIALLLGPFTLFARRRGAVHKALGYVWIMAMVATATSSFWIGEFGVIGRFSPLHLLACLALISVVQALWYARCRQYADHGTVMRSLYFYGLVIAGLFTLLPGRTMNRMLFADMPQAGLWVMGVGLVAIAWTLVRRRLRHRGTV